MTGQTAMDRYLAGRHELAIDAAAAAATVALLVTVHAGVTAPPRLFLALIFVTVVPGWALIGCSRVGDPWSRIALTVATSFTICALTSLASLWLRIWTPLVLFDFLALGSLVGLGVNAYQRLRDADDREPA